MTNALTVPVQIDCHAQIGISAGPDGLILEMAAVNDEHNQAVQFAKWICENAETLMAMSRPTKVIASVVPRLLGPDGKLAQ